MALLKHPENPFESIYSPSVLAAQNSASFTIRTTARYLDKAPESTLRCWDVWINFPSAAVSKSADALALLGYRVLSEPIPSLSRLSVILDCHCFDRDTCVEYAIQRDERLGSCDQNPGERHGLLVERKGSAASFNVYMFPPLSLVSSSL
ncbi:hypothetical protein BDM02DRAFT_3188936 [Thelephora ganbajun]|uniref:Uncharacterized protein n=1 Tax=Thelephora ganbajun TaxID=370292 RepID=A0ACB6Z9B7_THEGA|nr:hypothetical protein BDM02DRAFT_3188936 [Thelephora ganbajun]